MLDPDQDPYQMNTDPQPWLKLLFNFEKISLKFIKLFLSSTFWNFFFLIKRTLTSLEMLDPDPNLYPQPCVYNYYPLIR
jgi:hypothetical protein